MEPPDGWQRILRAFENQRNFCRATSPLMEALMDEAARGVMPLAAEEDPWPEYAPFAEALAGAWAERRFLSPVEPSLLVGATLHRAVLLNMPEAKALAPFYPSVGGHYAPADRDGLRSAFQGFWREASPDTRRFLREGKLQTNEISRAPAWLFPAAALHVWFGASLRLLDLGTSAGLNLAADRLAWRWTTPQGILETEAAGTVIEQRVEGVLPFPGEGRLVLPAVEARLGIDLRPVNVRDPAQRLLLRSCVWADETVRLARLDAAMSAFTAFEGPEAPRLVAGDMADEVARLPFPQPRSRPSVVLAFNTVATTYLPEEAYGRLASNLAARFRALPPGEAGLWVELEGPRMKDTRGPEDERFLRLTAHTLAPDGTWVHHALGHAEPHPRTWRLNPEGWESLRAALARSLL
ncbi:MAG TPA: DUF2332 family protein [Candidatus Thermoplasmatota archaeon]|nr:DUF2332 family protein [Candidatus Thermoplasmatota archaeon]